MLNPAFFWPYGAACCSTASDSFGSFGDEAFKKGFEMEQDDSKKPKVIKYGLNHVTTLRAAACLALLAAAPAGAQLASVKTVFVILMENHNWSEIKGSSSAPYTNNTLLPLASHAEQYLIRPEFTPVFPTTCGSRPGRTSAS